MKILFHCKSRKMENLENSCLEILWISTPSKTANIESSIEWALNYFNFFTVTFSGNFFRVNCHKILSTFRFWLQWKTISYVHYVHWKIPADNERNIVLLTNSQPKGELNYRDLCILGLLRLQYNFEFWRTNFSAYK